jgi:NADPH-dependent curcumin reductase CurA
MQVNCHWTLVTRPVGAPTVNNFSFVNSKRPSRQSGENLLRTVFLSLAPYMLVRMNLAKPCHNGLKMQKSLILASL